MCGRTKNETETIYFPLPSSPQSCRRRVRTLVPNVQKWKECCSGPRQSKLGAGLPSKSHTHTLRIIPPTHTHIPNSTHSEFPTLPPQQHTAAKPTSREGDQQHHGCREGNTYPCSRRCPEAEQVRPKFLAWPPAGTYNVSVVAVAARWQSHNFLKKWSNLFVRPSTYALPPLPPPPLLLCWLNAAAASTVYMQ